MENSEFYFLKPFNTRKIQRIELPLPSKNTSFRVALTSAVGNYAQESHRGAKADTCNFLTEHRTVGSSRLRPASGLTSVT
jgi:hypothetical protein